jgi:hypothetical protein
MKYLLHCIVEQGLEDLGLAEPGQAASGLAGPSFDATAQGICVVAGHGLAVVASREELTEPPSVAKLLAYERVVESIHARQTVLPLRYGCLMESEGEILRLLEERREEYEALLNRLRGMTEIGIRLLGPAHAAAQPSLAPLPGAAYLASLRQRYNVSDTLMPEEAEAVGRIADLLADQFAEQRCEVSSSSQGRLVSLAFLTPKTRVEEFRQKAREISPPSGAKLLLSGPWPPYSFVASAG